MRNGKNLVLLVISDSAERLDPKLEGVFSSLRMLPRTAAPGQKGGAPDGKWTCTVPSPMRPRTVNKGEKLEWLSYDTATSVSYEVIPDTVSKYRWYASDSIFWKHKIEGYRLGGKHDVEVKEVVNGDRTGKELFISGKGNIFCKRVRLFLDGDVLYELFVAGERDFLQSDAVNTFFTSFRFKNPPGKSTLTTPKTALLLHDLAGPDSVERSEAYQALSEVPFEKNDGPLLRQALFHQYHSPWGWDTTVSTTVNDLLAGQIAKLDDSASVAFIRDSYGSLTGEKERYRNTALGLLARQHTQYSYSVLGDLLAQGPISGRLGFNVMYGLKDSLRLTAGIFPSFKGWAGDTLQAATIANIAVQLLDSGYLQPSVIEAWSPAFIGAANALSTSLKKNEQPDAPYLSRLLQLIGRCHTPAVYAALRGYLSVKDKDLVLEAALQLADAGQPVPATVFQRLAEDPAYRVTLYDRLTKKKKSNLFPVQYSTRGYFAKSLLYQAANEHEDGEGGKETLEFLSKRTAVFDGVRYTWFLYKVSFSDGENISVHLGVCGGYSVGGTTLKPDKDLTGVYWKEDFDGNRIDDLFKAFLDGRKEMTETD